MTIGCHCLFMGNKESRLNVVPAKNKNVSTPKGQQ